MYGSVLPSCLSCLMALYCGSVDLLRTDYPTTTFKNLNYLPSRSWCAIHSNASRKAVNFLYWRGRKVCSLSTTDIHMMEQPALLADGIEAREE